MYRFEGEFVARPPVEQYLGKFGIAYDSGAIPIYPDVEGNLTRQTTVYEVGTEEEVTQKVAGMILTGVLPSGMQAEHITTPEQAVIYADCERVSVRGARFEKDTPIDPISAVTGFIDPAEGILVTCAARVWKERRFPAATPQGLVFRRLMSQVVYDLGNGWRDTTNDVGFLARRQVGLVRPTDNKTV